MSSINGDCVGTKILSSGNKKTIQFQSVEVNYQSAKVLLNGENKSFIMMNVSLNKNFV